MQSTFVSNAARDVRHAARLLLRARGFSVAAVATLALGIGANTAIFSVLDAVLLRPLPYSDPDRVVVIGERQRNGAAGNVGYTTFLDWRDRTGTFEQMALIRSWTATLTNNGEPERVPGLRVSWNFFRMLGVSPALGRDFNQLEDNPSAWQVVVLSDGLWRRRFGADPSVIGRIVTMNDRPFTIVGVMPPRFEPLISEHFYQPAELWSLVGYDRSMSSACRTCQHLKAIGRIRVDTTLEAARRDVDRVQNDLRRGFPSEYGQGTMTLVPIRDELTGDLRPVLLLLMAAVAFVLLIACANVANLLLARMARREHDLALRAALGASRSRIISQLLAETGLLAVLGGAAGVLITIVAVPALTSVAPATMERLVDVHLNGRILAFSAFASLATALAFGLLPAVRGSRVDVAPALQGGRKTSSAANSVARRMLVAADVALASVLLVGAGLMIRSVTKLLDVNPGFEPANVLSLQVSMIGRAYATDESTVARTDEIIARLRELPAVTHAAAASQIPLGGNGDCYGLHVQGRVPAPEDPCVERYGITPSYFDVMRIPILRGRVFNDADRANTEPVIVLGEQTARTVWPNGDAIGQYIRMGAADSGPWRKVIGIVGNVRHEALAAATTMQMYTPQSQFTDSFLVLVLRVGPGVRHLADSAALVAQARRKIWDAAPDVPVYGAATLEDLVAKSAAPRRFVMLLLELFGAIALIMTSVGIYGVVAYSVAERTREIGVRAALGASKADIVRLVVGSGLAVVVSGLAIGFAIAAGATRYLESSLFGTSPTDPATFATAVLVLLTVAIAAQTVPVIRAIRVDPAVALRQD